MHVFKSITAFAVFTMAHIAAQEAPVAPKMTLIYSMVALLGERFSLSPITTGDQRSVIPIVGGTFKGPRIEGTVLNVGADWLLTDTQAVTRPDARYAIRTVDGANIVVVTEGFPEPGGGKMLRAKFEASTNGSYAWLNDVVGVGVLKSNGTNAVRIDMWHATPGDGQ